MSHILPEAVYGRADGFIQGSWQVRDGSAQRGGAWCALSERIISVPRGADARSRVIRAHELMHIRVSPHSPLPALLTSEIHARALECAEELRVNVLLARSGFRVDELRDGSEGLAAATVAANDDWAEIVYFTLAVMGTGGEKELWRGVRREKPEWLAPLRLVRRQCQRILDATTMSDMASTDVSDGGTPRGYVETTTSLARLAQRAAMSAVPRTTDEMRSWRRSMEPGGRRPPSGHFATLVLDESAVVTLRRLTGVQRRWRPSTTGVVLRYPQRMLNDDLRRGFGRRDRRAGGVVIIDMSGSMDLSVEDVATVLMGAPQALVVGYSHRPGDATGAVNAWVLARAGHMAAMIPTGNVGNGVDGPVLRWALSQPEATGGLTWVTDGQVTDSNDHPCDTLSLECASLVFRHRIRMVRRLSEVTPQRADGWSTGEDFGRVGRKLQDVRP